jgi:hypothetical protein
MDIDFHDLSFKAKRLYERIKSFKETGLYHNEMSESQQNIVGVLVEHGLVERTYGSWSGETIYRACSQTAQ